MFWIKAKNNDKQYKYVVVAELDAHEPMYGPFVNAEEHGSSRRDP